MKSAPDAFLNFCVFLPLCSEPTPLTKSKSDLVVFLVKLSWWCCYGLAPGSLWRGLTVRCLPPQIRFLLFPHWISLRPSCLAKHSWLNVRHEPSCQEKAGGGAAGLGRPQFGISLLFVIHTEKNESRCRSRGIGERKGERQSSKTRGLSGNRYCRNKSKAIFVKQYMLYREPPAKWGFNYTNSSHKAQTFVLAGLNHSGWGLRTTVFFLANMLSYIKAPLML